MAHAETVGQPIVDYRGADLHQCTRCLACDSEALPFRSCLRLLTDEDTVVTGEADDSLVNCLGLVVWWTGMSTPLSRAIVVRAE